MNRMSIFQNTTPVNVATTHSLLYLRVLMKQVQDVLCAEGRQLCMTDRGSTAGYYIQSRRGVKTSMKFKKTKFKVGDIVRETFEYRMGRIDKIEVIAGLETYFVNGCAFYEDELMEAAGLWV